MVRVVCRAAWNAFAVVGIAATLMGLYSVRWALQTYDLTPHQFAVKAARKLGVDSRWVKDLLSPTARYGKTPLQGRLAVDRRPRVLYRGQGALEEVRARFRNDASFRRRVERSRDIVRWAIGRDLDAGERAIRKLVNVYLETPRAQGKYGNGLDIALAYDLLADHPGWTVGDRQRVNGLIRRSIEEALIVLDGDSASLWHGRTQLACSAWVAAVAMDPSDGQDERLLRRAEAHFLEVVSALDLTGGWPEGYTYWINNRALPVALAALAHVNGMDSPSLNRRITRTMTELGLWTIYGTEPIGRFHLFGDTGPRNDLKDETQRVIDLISLLTGDPLFRDYSRYLSGLHGREAYYGKYRWEIPLFRGPPASDFSKSEVLRDLAGFDGRLPLSRVFGREAFGQVFMRSSWSPDGMFVSYRAGHTFTHHGHYQAGHFTITKKAPLAVTSGTYAGWTTPHRLNYYIRTVAANSLLILRPGEKVRPNRFFKMNVADGGQRVVMPTGSAIVSVEEWKDNLYRGKHYEGGRITAFENADPRFVYVGSDLTGAYNSTAYDDNGDGGKVSRVTRQLLFLPAEETLVVHDRVVSTETSYTKKWLLHSWSKPETGQELVLKGTADDGILESPDDRALIRYRGGVLQVVRLLPKGAVIRKVGGPHYRYYVEADGDDSDLDGTNMDQGADERPWFDAGLWRLEVQPTTPRKEDRFLVALKAGVEGSTSQLDARLIETSVVEGLETPESIVLFGKAGMVREPLEYVTPSAGSRLHVVVDVPPSRDARVRAGGRILRVRSSPEGVLWFSIDPGEGGVVRVDFP